MPDPMQVIRHAGLPVSRWPNGAGRKADIAVGDGWLVGFAWLDADAPFSDYTGHDRSIMLVEGPGFTLDFADGRLLAVTVPFVPVAFDGGWPAHCRIAGPSRVLNVVTRRTSLDHRFTTAAGSRVVTSKRGLAQLLVVLRGTVQLSAPAATATLGLWDAVCFKEALTAVTSDDGLLASITVTRTITRQGSDAAA